MFYDNSGRIKYPTEKGMALNVEDNLLDFISNPPYVSSVTGQLTDPPVLIPANIMYNGSVSGFIGMFYGKNDKKTVTNCFRNFIQTYCMKSVASEVFNELFEHLILQDGNIKMSTYIDMQNSKPAEDILREQLEALFTSIKATDTQADMNEFKDDVTKYTAAVQSICKSLQNNLSTIRKEPDKLTKLKVINKDSTKISVNPNETFEFKL
jgi:hypothetical protein